MRGAALNQGRAQPMPSSSSRNASAAPAKPKAARPRPTRPKIAASPKSKAANSKAVGIAKPAAEAPFWKQKPLEALSQAEWESLCDGCGRCCLVKLEDEDTGQIHYTDIACKLFSAETCRCADYAQRRRKVHDCVKLTPAVVRSLNWLPRSCAYRLIAEGRDLAWWHPLVSGSPSTVHEAGVSVRGRVALSETEVQLADYPDYIVSWPGQAPKPAKTRGVGAGKPRRRAEPASE